ncbi:MAG: hypothetical protein DI587_03335 [Variovorax paradoxus]|nr:MAG: hypothetical protein DI583_03335 [Variovorax paradoxus]PZQ15731.1 MAG: hypothetical protein DI587_03335 [Variovorax paradoxus]
MGQNTVSIRQASYPKEPDLSLPTGLRQRGGVWQLRIGRPADLAHLYPGLDAYRSSLGTRDRAEAITKAHALIAQYRETFDRQRAAEQPRTTPGSSRLTAALLEHLRYRVLNDDDGNAVSAQRLALVPVPAEVLGVAELAEDPLARLGQTADALQAYVDALAALFAVSEFDMARTYAAMVATEMGIPPVDWTTAPAELPKFARGVVTTYQALAGRAQGQQIDTPPAPAPLAAPPDSTAIPKSRKLADVFEAWRVGQSPDAVGKTKRALAKLGAAGIDEPLHALTRHHGLAFRDHINATMPGQSGKTRSDVLAAIQALLNFAVKEKGWLEVNPWAKTAIPKGRAQKRIPWNHERLEVLFAAPVAEDRRVDEIAQYWLPLLALLTGARQAELCNLRVSDVVQRDGVWLLDINEEDDGKRVKSDAGIRMVPVHSKLIHLGFLDHVEGRRRAGGGLVFPGILVNPSRTASLYLSDWFRDRCQALGVYKRWSDFHALRTTVNTALHAVRPALGGAVITALIGHEPGDVGVRHYHVPAPETLRHAIESLSFPSVMDLPRVYPTPSAL